MSKSSPSKAAGVLIAATLLAGPWSANSQRPVANDQETVLTRARDFLHVLYPELFGRDAFLHVSVTQGIDQSWRQVYAIGFDVMPYNPLSERMLNPPVDAKTGKRLPPPPNTFLRGHVWFNREGWLHQFEAAGEAAREKSNEEIHELVESHPEWSESEAFNALKKAGARYGPGDKEQFIQSIHLEKLEPFMGRLKIKSAEFQGLTEPREGSFAVLSWRIEAEAELPSGKRSAYILRFEPFGGRLVGVIEGKSAEVTPENR